VAGRAERRHVVRTEILHLVDEQGDARTHVGGDRRRVGEQLDQIDLDVAGVGAAAGRRHVDAGLPPVAQLRVGRCRPQCERLEHTEEVVDPVRRAVPGGQLAHGHVQRGRDRAAQRLVGPGLDLPGAPQPADGLRAQRVEQHRLADAAQPGEHEAALGAAARDPLQDDIEHVQLTAAAGQLGRPLTGAGCVGVAHRIHA
jgi:hypothetical protein